VPGATAANDSVVVGTGAEDAAWVLARGASACSGIDATGPRMAEAAGVRGDCSDFSGPGALPVAGSCFAPSVGRPDASCSAEASASAVGARVAEAPAGVPAVRIGAKLRGATPVSSADGAGDDVGMGEVVVMGEVIGACWLFRTKGQRTQPLHGCPVRRQSYRLGLCPRRLLWMRRSPQALGTQWVRGLSETARP
jgi:hypothetical protein